MSDSVIQKLVCQAVVSDQYRARLLGSDRAEVLRTSGLDEFDQEALLGIQAQTLEEFAAGIERMARRRKQAVLAAAPNAGAVLRGWIELEIPPRST